MRCDLEGARDKVKDEEADSKERQQAGELAAQVAALAEKLSRFEREREETRRSLEEETAERVKEIDNIRQMILVYRDNSPGADTVAILPAGQDVEVTLEGPIQPECYSGKQGKDTTRNTVWSTVCGCLPSHSVE